MWAIVIVTLGLLTGPQTYVVTDAGTFHSKAECQKAIAANVPRKLAAETKAEYEAGYRQYVCVRVHEHSQKEDKGKTAE